ncbi:MAG TPA: multiubiquitin domain-containing protein [Actinomycetota bacterium]|nr:multiubiquitin domain-containing protein [Actinomycetota bacterium]
MIVQNRFTFDTARVTGRQIKQTAAVPAGFALYRRAQGGNEPIADDEEVVLRRGDHLFARPSSEP